jgi:hypothetical protein
MEQPYDVPSLAAKENLLPNFAERERGRRTGRAELPFLATVGHGGTGGSGRVWGQTMTAVNTITLIPGIQRTMPEDPLFREVLKHYPRFSRESLIVGDGSKEAARDYFDTLLCRRIDLMSGGRKR